MPTTTSIEKLVQDFLQTKGNLQLNAEATLLKALDNPSIRSESYANRNIYFLTAHKLMDYEECPYFAKLHYLDLAPYPVEKKNDAFLMGDGTEDVIKLSASEFNAKYKIVSRRTKAEQEAAEAEGKELLNETMASTLVECQREFRTSPWTTGGLERRNIIAPFSGYCLKAELDHFDEQREVPVDLKTCANLNTFEKDFHEGTELFERYAFQQAFYSFVYELRYGKHFDQAELLVIDKYEWSRSQKFTLGYQTILRPRYDRIERLIAQWKDSEESGIWPMVDLSRLEGRQIFRNSPYWLLAECQQFKKTIPVSIF